MCDICRQTPCSSRCPNVDEPIHMGHCLQCHCDLTEDNTYFSDRDGNCFCSVDCAMDYYEVEEREWNR